MLRNLFFIIFAIISLSLHAEKKYLPDIKGRTQYISSPLTQLDLREYWRSNILVKDGIFTSAKKDKAQHVPGLVEYRVFITEAGEYALKIECNQENADAMQLSFDGNVLGATKTGKSTFKVLAGKGEHYIRLTSPKVHSRIPVIKSVSLKFNKAKKPAVEAQKTIHQTEPLTPGWDYDLSRKIHLDFHTGGFVEDIGSKWDADAFASTLADNGLNSVTIFAKGHHGYAYYNTKIGTRHPGLDFDLMQEQIEACHKRGIKVLIYFSVQVDELWASTEEGPNRDWGKFMDVDANPDKSYVKDYTWPMIREVIENYDIDGFWFDFPGYDSFVTQTIDLIKGINPNLPSAYNHQFDKDRDVLAQQDIMEIEAWEHGQSLYRWSYLARYAHGSTPLVGMTIGFWNMWGDFGTVTTEAMFQYETALAYANGCGITIGDQLHPNGRLEPAVYARMKPAMEMGKMLEPYVQGYEFEPYVAVLRRKVGLIPAITDNSWHYNVVDESQDISKYKALFIMDASKVEDDYVAKLNEYVSNGGNLIICGNPTEKVAELAGVSVSDQEAESAYIANRSGVLKSVIQMDVFVKKEFVACKALEGTETITPMVWQMNHGTSHNMSHRQSPAMDQRSEFAGITLRQLGEGKVIYTPAPLLEQYAKDGNEEMARILKDMFEMVVPESERLIQVEGKVNLEVSIMKKDDKHVIHLIHCPQARRSSSVKYPVISEFPTVKNHVLKLNKDLVKGRKLKIVTMDMMELEPLKTEGENVVYQLPDFEINMTLIVEGK
ncbi:MAG: alpha-L-fucosidase [Bacteroidales bacterium]|nr:alpha-L-fucosidase [Bacteroidales bacterium]